jgi:hypothetical protein
MPRSTPRKVTSIHSKCLGFLEEEGGVILICSKSKGHSSELCYDPDENRSFVPEFKKK